MSAGPHRGYPLWRVCLLGVFLLAAVGYLGRPRVVDSSRSQLLLHSAERVMVHAPWELDCTSFKAPEKTVFAGVNGLNLTLYKAEDDVVSKSIIGTGTWEAEALQQIMFAMGQPVDGKPDRDPVFVDVGANIGWFSSSVASWGYRVLAFEGMQRNADIIRSTICANPSLQSRIKLYQLGLGQKDENCFLWSHPHNTGDGNMYCGEDESGIRQYMGQDFEYVLQGKMAVTRLDSVLDEDIKVLKMDVEGGERNVLRGAIRLLSKRRVHYIQSEYAPAMLSGINGPGGPAQFRALLFAMGYNCSTQGFSGPFLTPLQFETLQEPLVNLYCARVPDHHYSKSQS